MKYLAPIPKQFVDQNGLPLSDGKVHVYISGDTQYANVYQDADGNELMPNPARLDSNGAWLGFVTAGIPLDYVVEDKDGNVQFEYGKVVAGGGDGGGGEGPVYVQESHTSSDSNVTVTSQKTTCTFDSNLKDFTGELHVRFQNSGQAATVTLYVNDEYNDKIISTLPVMSGMTHLMVPLSIPAGSLRAEVTFATASTPSSVKFDLGGYNLGSGGGGGSVVSAMLPLKVVNGVLTNNGTNLTCTGDNAWAEGKSNEATGDYSHAEGQLCKAKGQASHAGGQACETSGQNSFAHGAYLKTSSQSLYPTAAFGMYNSDQKAMFVIGNGTAENNRKDAFKVDSSGNTWVTIGGTLTKVTNVSGGDQFVLVRSNMTTNFTNAEYQDCVDAVTAGKAVCVQFERNSRTFQAQLTQVEHETGLLVFEIDVANIHITYEVSGTNNSHTITESDYQNGTPIFDTLQDAITWNVVLHNGDIFETNGFHTSGDGGAGRYKVSSTGTEDGINTILMSANKYALLQRFDSIYPVEQSTTESDLRLYATTSVDTKINDSGNLVADATFTLYRFNDLVPHSVVVIETDGNCAFSTSPSINDRVGGVIKKGANIVPPCGHWLLCSASDSYGTPKVRLYNNSAGAQAAKIAYGYDRLATAYNTSVGSGLDDYGEITSDASKTITRFNNLNEGDIVSVETDDKFIFSSSASGTGRVGYPRKSGVYVIPKGISWMLVASSSSLAPVVNIIDRSTKLEDYGIRIYKSAIPSIRLGRAGNFSYSLNSARNAISDFDNCFPWNQMRVCNISISGGMKTVVYEGQAGFSYNNDTFVEVPAFYFKRVVHDTYEDWYVSNHGGDGFELEPWFKDGYGNKLAVRYVARFVHSNNGLSCVGQPTVVKPKSFFKTEFESNGFELMSIYGYQALQHLLVVELGTKNTQSIFNGVSNYKYIENSENIITSSSGSTNYVEIAAGDVKNTYFAVGDQVVIFPTSSTDWGDGIVRTLTAFSYDSNVIKFTFDGAPISITSGVSSIFGCMQNNGKCNSVHTNGGMQSTGPVLTRSFLWRGIENLYGNLGEFVDLINYDFTATRLSVQGKYLTFESPYRPNYIDGPTPSYIFSMGVDKNFPTLTLPESTTTNPNSGYCDDWSTFGSGGNGDVVYGAAWDHLTGNGAFCLRAVTSGTNNLLYTGRAML